MDFDDARCCRNSNLEMVRLYDVDDVPWPMCNDIAADFNDFNGPAQTTNLGVRSSNLFGRAILPPF
jgi:hypothetical protein